MKDKEFQEKLYLYQIMKSQIENLESQMEALQEALGDAMVTEACLKELKEGERDFFPSIGSGIFLLGNDKVLVNMGAGVFVKKSMEEGMKIVKSRREKIEKSMEEVAKRLESLRNDLLRLEMELEKGLNQKETQQNINKT